MSLIYINQAFRHYKPIGVAKQVCHFLTHRSAKLGPGIVVAIAGDADFGEKFVDAIAMQRFWDRDIY